MAEPVNVRVLIDDGTPRLPFPFRVQLSLTVLRLKQMIEEQEGFAVSEQQTFFQGRELLDNVTLGQQGVTDAAHIDVRIDFQEIPSPTRKKGSTSTCEDCVVPDIDDEDNVFNFEQPRVPLDPRAWTKWEVVEWLKWATERYGVRDITADKFLMNGKGLCMLNLDSFLYRVPRGGDLLYSDFQRRLHSANKASRALENYLNGEGGPSNFYYVY